MDTEAWKFHRTVIPTMIHASVTHDDGHTHILALVCLLDDDEGQALLESSTGHVATGEWSINRTHDEFDEAGGGATPTVISVSFPDSSEVDPALLEELLDELVKRGGTWGLDGHS